MYGLNYCLLNAAAATSIGIHLGKLIIGKVKISGKYTDSIMGISVNITARLQALTKELNNNIIISEEVARRSDTLFITPTIDAKLKSIDYPGLVYLIGNSFSNVNS